MSMMYEKKLMSSGGKGSNREQEMTIFQDQKGTKELDIAYYCAFG